MVESTSWDHRSMQGVTVIRMMSFRRSVRPSFHFSSRRYDDCVISPEQWTMLLSMPSLSEEARPSPCIWQRRLESRANCTAMTTAMTTDNDNLFSTHTWLRQWRSSAPNIVERPYHTAAAVVFKSHIIAKRLPNSVSIYTAKLYAILLALNELSKQQHKHYLLFFWLSI